MVNQLLRTLCRIQSVIQNRLLRRVSQHSVFPEQSQHNSLRLTSNRPLGLYCTALFADPPDTTVCNTEPKQTMFTTPGINLADFAYQVVKIATPFVFTHAAGSQKGQKRSEVVEASTSETKKSVTVW